MKPMNKGNNSFNSFFGLNQKKNNGNQILREKEWELKQKEQEVLFLKAEIQRLKLN